jgi:hypothetical protein
VFAFPEVSAMASAFRHYTNLPATIYMLRKQCLTLRDPSAWEDKNDAHFIAAYKKYQESKGAKAVLALCFAECDETYHHWRVFSHGSDGVCVEFEKERILSIFKDNDLFKQGYMQYKWVSEIERMEKVEPDKLPFIKRKPFEGEREYRIVYVDYGDDKPFKDFRMDIGCVRKIVLSPWIPKRLFTSVKATIKAIDECVALTITRSSLLNNDAFKLLASRMDIEQEGGAQGAGDESNARDYS